MSRVFLGCGDNLLYDDLRSSFCTEHDFEICVEHNRGLDAIMEAIELLPDLVILGDQIPSLDGLPAGKMLKLSIPNVQVFLVVETISMETERVALSLGIDAVFRTDDLSSLILNARTVCGLETASARSKYS